MNDTPNPSSQDEQAKAKKKKSFIPKWPKRTVKEKSCGVILFREDKNDSGKVELHYLLLHYPGGHWDFPKGHVEKIDKGEKATAFRELNEETGIKYIEFVKGYREPMYYAFNRGRKERVKKVVVYYLAITKELDVKLSHEHQGCAWLPFDEGMAQLTFDNARDLLQKADDHLKENPDYPQPKKP